MHTAVVTINHILNGNFPGMVQEHNKSQYFLSRLYSSKCTSHTVHSLSPKLQGPGSEAILWYSPSLPKKGFNGWGIPVLHWSPQSLRLVRLLQSPSLVVVELSVGYKTWPPNSWHHPSVISCLHLSWGMPQLQCLLGSPDQWEFPTYSPNGSLLSVLCKDSVKESTVVGGKCGQWVIEHCSSANKLAIDFYMAGALRQLFVPIMYCIINYDSISRTWLHHQMETFSALMAICAGNSQVPGEFPSQRPVTRSSDVFFDLSLDKRLSKQSWGWWFEMLSHPLWHHCNGERQSKAQKWCVNTVFLVVIYRLVISCKKWNKVCIIATSY